MLGQDRLAAPRTEPEEDFMNSTPAVAGAMVVGAGIIIGSVAAVFRIGGWSTSLDCRRCGSRLSGKGASGVCAECRRNDAALRRFADRSGPGLW